MEQNLPIPQSVKIRQNIAAVMLVLTDIFGIIVLVGLPITPLITTIIGIVGATAWGLLYSTASNKATRVASITIIVFTLITALINLLVANTPPIAIYVFHIIKPLTSIYAYSTLLKGNDNINAIDKTWINYIIVALIGTFAINLYNFGFGYMFPQRDYDFIRQYNFSVSFIWQLWCIAYYIFMAIAEFRMAKCAAFNGNYTTESAPKGTYSPINKYFAALIIAIPITLSLLWVIFSNLESIENIF